MGVFTSSSKWPTIPQVFVGGEFIGGCDITLQMQKNGELGPLLQKHGAIPAKKAE